MRPNKFHCWAIILLTIALLAPLSCEKFEKRSPTGVEAIFQDQALGKISLPAVLTSPPDIIVNTTADVSDFDGGQQVSDLPGPDGVVSLREAIMAANNTAGANVIGFHILTSDPGFDGTVFTIRPIGYTLPALGDDGTTIDGATQTAFIGNTNVLGPEIVLDGSSVYAPKWAILIFASNCRIHSLVIHSFNQVGGGGIGINMGMGNRVTGCFIGTDHTGTVAKGNPVGVGVASDNNVIGGAAPGEGNLISGNTEYGVVVFASSNNIVEGNLIGTDVTGRIALPNDTGMEILDATQNLIGGTGSEQGNVISGNAGHGINFRGSANNNIVRENFIGTDANGTLMVGNGGFGVGLSEGTQNTLARNIISGNLSGGVLVLTAESTIESNTISYNRGDGIWMGGCPDNPSSRNNTISRNLFSFNFGLAINLGCNAVTPNDPGDMDAGPNDFMNYPVLESAKATPGKLIVKGYIDTPNPKTVTIEFFANPVPDPGSDPSGHGEGAIYLGSDRPNPKGKFTATLPTVAPGTLISATATDVAGNTSEFAANIVAEAPGK